MERRKEKNPLPCSCTRREIHVKLIVVNVYPRTNTRSMVDAC